MLLTRDNLLPYVRGMSEIAFYFARPLRACELIFAPDVGNIGGCKGCNPHHTWARYNTRGTAVQHSAVGVLTYPFSSNRYCFFAFGRVATCTAAKECLNRRRHNNSFNPGFERETTEPHSREWPVRSVVEMAA